MLVEFVRKKSLRLNPDSLIFWAFQWELFCQIDVVMIDNRKILPFLRGKYVHCTLIIFSFGHDFDYAFFFSISFSSKFV